MGQQRSMPETRARMYARPVRSACEAAARLLELHVSISPVNGDIAKATAGFMGVRISIGG